MVVAFYLGGAGLRFPILCFIRDILHHRSVRFFVSSVNFARDLVARSVVKVVIVFLFEISLMLWSIGAFYKGPSGKRTL